MQVAQSTYIYDDDGNVVNETQQGHQRNWTNIDDVSPFVLDAFVAIEDRKFYDHHGFDYMRIGAAVLKKTYKRCLVAKGRVRLPNNMPAICF